MPNGQNGLPSPIRAKPSDRDPMRNFKFRVQFLRPTASGPDAGVSAALADMGFTTVSGINLQTEMIPYREGGDNTSPRKFPGQSDFGPLTMMGGVFLRDKNGGWEWMKMIYSLIWGQGNASFDVDFRFDIVVNVLKHPVTSWSAGGVGDPFSSQSAGAAFKFYNCWPASWAVNDLNAGDNSILISQATVHHEGFEPLFGAPATAGSFSV
jgi:phage tail-like protein